jgi:hypothetical protein
LRRRGKNTSNNRSTHSCVGQVGRLTDIDRGRVMGGGHKLEVKHKRFIYQQLALGRRSDQILDDLQSEFGVTCTRQNISFYAAKTEIIAACRAEIKENIEDNFAVARMEVRLNEYQHLLRDAEGLGDIPIESYLNRFAASEDKEKARLMLEFAAEIAQRPKDKIELQMKILRQVREEVKPLSLEVDDKRKPKQISFRGVPAEKLKKLIRDMENLPGVVKGED